MVVTTNQLTTWVSEIVIQIWEQFQYDAAFTVWNNLDLNSIYGQLANTMEGLITGSLLNPVLSYDLWLPNGQTDIASLVNNAVVPYLLDLTKWLYTQSFYTQFLEKYNFEGFARANYSVNQGQSGLSTQQITNPNSLNTLYTYESARYGLGAGYNPFSSMIWTTTPYLNDVSSSQNSAIFNEVSPLEILDRFIDKVKETDMLVKIRDDFERMLRPFIFNCQGIGF